MRYNQIFEKIFLEISVHLTFILEFSKFSVEWFAFQKFNSFRIFWNFTQEIFVPFVPVSKISEFLVKWQAPNISTYSIFNSLHTVSEHGTASYIALQSS